MKNCIQCGQEIGDESVFCPNCRAKQDAEARKIYPISERAFVRLFRPSFFGGLSGLGMYQGSFLDTAEFLSLSRELSGDERQALQRGLDLLLNNAGEEYAIGERNKAEFGDVFPKIENEKFRFNFVSDAILHRMELFKSSGSVGTKMFAVLWLFSLLSALDGNYSDEKQMFFARAKNLFPIPCDEFLKALRPNDLRDEAELVRFLHFLGHFEKITSFNNYQEWLTLEDENGVETQTSIDELCEQFPADFDFYAVLEEKTKKLCDLEHQIQELEHSEGAYFEIADKIAALAREERALTQNLSGFTYCKW